MDRDIAFGDVSPATRLTLSVAGGVVAGVLVLRGVPYVTVLTAVLAGWAVAATGFAVSSWVFLWGLDAAQTRDHATREEPTRPVADGLVLTACATSLVSIVVVLGQQSGPHRDVALIAAFAAVVASWLALNTLFAVRYAWSWYTEPLGGIDFNQSAPPQYSDFAYVALTVAMSFATSDPNVTDSGTRRLLLLNALLAYLFGTFLVALLVNVVAGL
ncbi:DUF1345 domain-containing protein [Cellulomonas xiejunii]|uniref:DUF1345 domain-containing protein n=1 Tax=Cellulomonas xiejunii TaxID=2968083 RepID=A0ABY5KMV3_9CELL|nr:DUF1345 domain-containing protein [Cellulomonas xiejunii]MCC2320826.1 DUF1345 domain-containing protein [Cellulomonas xiejunii]UUI71109.1 DUF1345 domain-containing protein [Cellulomonas xiejunii]